MSALLDSALTPQQRRDCAVTLRRFLVHIGRRGDPRLSFEVMAPNAQRAGEQADDLVRIGERCDVELVEQFGGQSLVDNLRAVGGL